ncbi:hypothetical protein [Streptomyces sp. NPDC085529]|uniref:hypothetical protein n=1 Tax=Streptomyces sp. NPDC085529 TaxID=3365729 RepID=UPI0037D2BF4A
MAEIQTRLNDPLVGLPGRGPRAQAAHWALVRSSNAAVRHAGTAARLVSVTLLAHTQPALKEGAADCQTLARMCGMTEHKLLVTAQVLLDATVLKSCSLVSGEDLAWSWPEVGTSRENSRKLA